MLKKLSKLLVALTLLLALYIGTYLFLYHTRSGTNLLLHSNDPDPFAYSNHRQIIGTIFEPARAAEMELVWHPKLKRSTIGRWHPLDPPATGSGQEEFIDIRPGGASTFTLGGVSGAGELNFDRTHHDFSLRFESAGTAYALEFHPQIYMDTEPGHFTTATVSVFPITDQYLVDPNATDPFRELVFYGSVQSTSRAN